MKYELNGISLPFGGISWNKTKSKKDIFSFLHDLSRIKKNTDKSH